MLKLIDAGFTASEIKEMRNAPTKEDPEPAETAQEDPKQDPLAPLLKEIQDLKRAVYAVNVMTSEQPATRSADEVLMNAMKGGQ